MIFDKISFQKKIQKCIFLSLIIEKNIIVDFKETLLSRIEYLTNIKRNTSE